MQRTSFLLVLALMLSLNLEAKKIEGQIIFEDDTVDVVFNIPITIFSREPAFDKIQHRVTYYDANGNKAYLSPDEAKEIRFKYDIDNIRMMSRNNNLGLGKLFVTDKNIFLHVKVDGGMRLFTYYYKPKIRSFQYETYRFFMLEEQSIIQRGDESLRKLPIFHQKREMMEFFSDCPPILEKIENKDYHHSMIAWFVRQYNAECYSTQ